MKIRKLISKFFVSLVGVTLIFSTSTTTLANDNWSEKQKIAHQIAELARGMGLDESDPIIVRSKEIWNENRIPEKVESVNPTDRDTIATAIYTEAWGGCSDRHRELVAAVIVNRVKSNRFPNTVTGVVTQRGQYPQGYANPNSTLGKRARQNPDVWAKCQEIATKALLGKVTCPSNVVFQAEFRQGSGIYEIHRTSYSTTYFCYL